MKKIVAVVLLIILAILGASVVGANVSASAGSDRFHSWVSES